MSVTTAASTMSMPVQLAGQTFVCYPEFLSISMTLQPPPSTTHKCDYIARLREPTPDDCEGHTDRTPAKATPKQL